MSSPGYDTEISPPSEPERDADGWCLCPATGCDFSSTTPFGLPAHYKKHDTSLTVDLFGDDCWRAYLTQEHLDNAQSPQEIAREFGAHIGEKQVRKDLRDYGIYIVLSTGQTPASARILMRPDVSTIADAQRVAAQKRGEL